ncbi:hypothetical protein ANN_18961 [Periplaneta americana]|uniref:DUF4817 domain-containing protein n=1 Tax=Periplaneta americana TaxID=6978 RepID=A0ABQ8SQ79_PERAM|nr:hypothetical protein ANN_18961 [Periplaneta americana]
MERYTKVEYSDILFAYGAARENCGEAQKIYRELHPDRAGPDHKTFISVHICLRDTDTFHVIRYYQNMLPDLLKDALLAVTNDIWLLHDGATPHFAQHVINHLDFAFDYIVGLDEADLCHGLLGRRISC